MEHKSRAVKPYLWSVVREGFLEEVTFNTEPRGPTESTSQDWGMYKSEMVQDSEMRKHDWSNG